jgi:glycosyltransferase involved in cell wall biosynthesis
MPVHTTGRWGDKKSVPRSVRFFFPWIDRVIAIADAQRDYLVEQEGIPAEKLVVIPNGIPSERPDPAERSRRRAALRSELGLDPDDQVVMILAVLRPEKNHELLLRAAARLREDHPRLVLLFVGDGPRRSFLEGEVSRLGLDTAVRFLGHQPDGRRFWGAADVAVLVSHPRVETLPLSLLEGMDFGLPVVATEVGAMREIVRPGENGELVRPGDEEELAARLGSILADRDAARTYGDRSQRIVLERYTSERMVRLTEELIRGLWGRRRPAVSGGGSPSR